MKNKIILIAAVLCFVLLLACGCNKGDEIVKAQQEAVEKVNTMVCQAVVTESNVTVYTYSKESAVMGENVAVTMTENKLNSSFVMEEKSSTQEVALDRSKFAVLDLSKEVVSEMKKADGVITGKISKDSLTTVLGADVQATDDASVTVEMPDGVLNKIVITFNMTSNKNVTLTYTYKY